MDVNSFLFEEALQMLGAVLEQRGRNFEIVTGGRRSLLGIGLSHRPTRDVDDVATARLS